MAERERRREEPFRASGLSRILRGQREAACLAVTEAEIVCTSGRIRLGWRHATTLAGTQAPHCREQLCGGAHVGVPNCLWLGLPWRRLPGHLRIVAPMEHDHLAHGDAEERRQDEEDRDGEDHADGTSTFGRRHEQSHRLSRESRDKDATRKDQGSRPDERLWPRSEARGARLALRPDDPKVLSPHDQMVWVSRVHLRPRRFHVTKRGNVLLRSHHGFSVAVVPAVKSVPPQADEHPLEKSDKCDGQQPCCEEIEELRQLSGVVAAP